IVSLGFIVSLAIYFFARFRIKTNFHNVLLESVYLSVIICAIGTFFIIQFLDIKVTALPAFLNINNNFILFIPYLIGLIGAILISYTAEILTSTRYSIAKQIAKETEFGAIISIFNSLAISFKSIFLFVIYILLIIIPSIYFAGFYGVLFASLGMLSVTGTILITNIFSPLILNTTKIIKLVNEDNIALKNVIKMERLAQTTIALGNGFLTGVSVLSTFNIFFAMLLIMGQKTNLMQLFFIDLKLLTGLIIGIALPLVFLGLLLSGLTKTILAILKEGHRQFRDIPYLDQDKARPDIIKVSDQTTIKAMNALIMPTALMLLMPIIIGYFFGVSGFKILLGMSLGTILISLTLGFAWSLVGEALNNAKNYIAKGHFGGSNSPNFTNIRLADNFGDAFKDLLSPSLNLFVKVFGILNIFIIIFLI
ncbi:MAG: sodium/proton-translocating pyrophosphatase, partial [Candidatus Margulisiibacteriota bacterium]